MKNIWLIVAFTVLTGAVSAKTWQRQSMTENAGYIPFNQVIVYNDSEITFTVNHYPLGSKQKLEIDSDTVFLSGLREHGLRIYYDLYPRDSKIVVHVAEDRGIDEGKENEFGREKVRKGR